MISIALMILVVIISLSIVSALQIPPKGMAQPPAEGAKVLSSCIKNRKVMQYHRYRRHNPTNIYSSKV